MTIYFLPSPKCILWLIWAILWKAPLFHLFLKVFITISITSSFLCRTLSCNKLSYYIIISRAGYSWWRVSPTVNEYDMGVFAKLRLYKEHRMKKIFAFLFLILISANTHAFFLRMWDNMVSDIVPGYGPPTDWVGWAYLPDPFPYYTVPQSTYPDEVTHERPKPVGRYTFSHFSDSQNETSETAPLNK